MVSSSHPDAGRARKRPPAAVGWPGLRVPDAAGATYDRVPCGAAESCGPLRCLCQRSTCSLVRRALPVLPPGHTLNRPSSVNDRLGATRGVGSTVAVERGPLARQATRGTQRRAERSLLGPEREGNKDGGPIPPERGGNRGQPPASGAYGGVVPPARPSRTVSLGACLPLCDHLRSG